MTLFLHRQSPAKAMGQMLIMILFFLLSGSVFAQTISIQGVLREPNGRSVEDGSYNVVFAIYEEATGGTALWQDTYASLKVQHGVFQANLGEQTSLDGIAFDTAYYVGITVENYQEMSPRLPVTIYPYAKSILGQDNKFPSIGNVVLERDSIIVKQGALKFEGADGRIVFNDGTSLNTAEFGGPASGLLNPSSININADKDAAGSGAINFQIAGSSKATIQNNGDADFGSNVTIAGYVAADSASFNKLNTDSLYVDDVAVVGGTSAINTEIRVDAVQSLNNGAASTLKLNPDGGNIGIGNTTPEVTFALGDADTGFDYNADGDFTIKSNGFTKMRFHAGGQIGLGDFNTPAVTFALGDFDTGINYVSDGVFDLFTNGFSRMRISSDGNIGIGDTDPTEARFVVRGTSTNNWNLSYYTDGNGHAGPGNSNPWSGTFSIYGSSGIGAGGGFFVVSDKRIKEIQGLSDKASDLGLLKKLRVTDYGYIDKVQHGNKVEKKLIAQEVREVYPQATTTRTDFVPDIYAISSSLAFDENRQELTVILGKNHDLKVGDKVKLLAEEGELIKEVLRVEGDQSFVVATDQAQEELFVYGKEVDDFLNIDYDAIAMLNVSATQELVRRVEEQEKRITELEKKNAALEAQNKKIETLEAKLNALLGMTDPIANQENLQLGKQ